MSLELVSLKRAFPKSVSSRLDQGLVDKINKMYADPQEAELFRDNVLSYCSVLTNGRYKMESYLDAVKYSCSKLGGSSNIDAYARTFPSRYSNMVAKAWAQKDISSVVSKYAANKLVMAIMDQARIPVSIVNADLYQKAINNQAWLMLNANSETVRCNATDSLMNQLKPPETAKIELDIVGGENSAITALRDSTLALVAQQKLAMDSGMSTAKDIAHSGLIIENEE